ncbi:MAG: cytochrome c [Myxococcota bacterium]
MNRARTCLLLALCLPLFACELAERALAPPEAPEDRLAAGRERFLRYCSSCHGQEAMGSGPVAATLKRPPADLTRIAVRRGEFDPDFVAKYIDGRIRIGAHGPADMPVWGRRLDDRNEELYQETRLTSVAISLIVDYLESIQVGPAPAAPKAEATSDSTLATMHRIFDALAYLLPASLDDELFSDPTESAAITSALGVLSESAGGLEAHAGAHDAAFRLLSGSLAADAREIQHRFAQGRYAEAQFFLQQLTENCVACHSRLPTRRDFPFGERLLDRMDLDRIAAVDRGRLLVSVRQFEQALRTWEQLLADPTVSAAEIDLAGVPLDYLTICIRVERDLARPGPVLEKFAQRPDMPRYLGHHLALWIESLRELEMQPDRPPTLERAKELADRSREYPATAVSREGLVYDLMASSLLHRYVDAGDQPEEALSEAYYLLGVIQARTGYASWVPETEFYLEAAIRVAPATESAEQAYLLLEEYTVLSYGGSSGTHLPADVVQKLSELRGLLDSS